MSWRVIQLLPFTFPIMWRVIAHAVIVVLGAILDRKKQPK